MRKKKRSRWVTVPLTLLLLGGAAFAGWNYLAPLLTDGQTTLYESYTVEQGDVSTDRCFSASMTVKNSESFTASEECTVREVYVTSGQEVRKGDAIAMLSTGEIFTASFPGVVNELRVSSGDWLRRNMTVAQVCDLTHLQVSMPVDEYDVEKVALGMKCTVTVMSLGEMFETEISHINRISASPGSVAYYTVTADLTVPESILPGMACTISIPAESAANVPVLAMAALAFDENGAPYVLRKSDDGSYAQVSVQTGLSDGMQVEIQSGLSVGDTVYAVSGTESAAPAFSLGDLYKRIVGETVVINEKSERGNRGGGTKTFDGTLPEGTDSSSFPQGDAGEAASEASTADEASSAASKGENSHE